MGCTIHAGDVSFEGNGAPLVEVRGLRKLFDVPHTVIDTVLRRPRQYVHAVDGVDLFIRRGETLGLVGESGSGKTTIGRLVVRLIEPTAGQVLFEGRDVLKLKGDELRKYRSESQIIFQDPYTSLDPRMTVGQIVAEPLEINGVPLQQRKQKIRALLDRLELYVGIVDRYPHQLPGGQRQLVGIAAALALDPLLVVADEPVSALDVSAQAQILNILMDLKEERGLSYLFISHDLSVVRHISDRVAVMYLGKIVEVGPTHALFQAPLHPYSTALLSAIPQVQPDKQARRIILKGEIPSPTNPPVGCRFYSRCEDPARSDHCGISDPRLAHVGGGRYVACHAVAET
jgi:oligopeptide/dipeptide ABC transporter ATP-binding protein